MSQENIITVPPRLPVKHPEPIITSPPKPPLIPGFPAAKGTPTAAAVKAKETERQQALPGAESTDPKNTGVMIAATFKNIVKIIPALLKKYWWVILIIAVLWVFLMTWDPITLQINHPNLSGLINAVDPVVTALIFLTAAYTHFVSKTIYVLIILRVILPLARRIKSEGWKKVWVSFKDVIPGIKRSFTACAPNAMPIFIGFIGAGLVLTNLLTLNNLWSKVLVPIALAFSMVKTLSDGKTSMSFLATRVVTKDISGLFKKKQGANNNQIYLGIAGAMIGLIGSIILALLKDPLGDTIGGNFGYILGAAGIIAGIVLYFIKRKSPETK